jgi:hypothetical protein
MVNRPDAHCEAQGEQPQARCLTGMDAASQQKPGQAPGRGALPSNPRLVVTIDCRNQPHAGGEWREAGGASRGWGRDGGSRPCSEAGGRVFADGWTLRYRHFTQLSRPDRTKRLG